MPFLSIPTTARFEVGPAGPIDAKIAIIGEAPGREEARTGKPFVGQAGRVLEEICHDAGLIKGQLYLTNVIKEKPPDTYKKKNDISSYFNERTGRFTEKGQPWVDLLREELQGIGANILVPMGKSATAAIIGPPAHKIMTYRGYIYEASGPAIPEGTSRKALPTIHPAETLYAPANYIHRYYISHDLHKARLHSETAEVVWDPVEAIVPETLGSAIEWLKYFNEIPEVSVDTESMNYEITCISFTDQIDSAVAIDFFNKKWTEDEEVILWSYIAKIIENPKVGLIGQNLIHDLELLALNMGIVYDGYIKDTMIMSSLMYPDFSKGLGFLGGVYTNMPYWKDIVKFNTSKEEA